MLYVFLSSVFIALFMCLGTLSMYGFYQLWLIKKFPLTWACYQHVFVLALLSLVSFILAVLFGIQIPENYGI